MGSSEERAWLEERNGRELPFDAFEGLSTPRQALASLLRFLDPLCVLHHTLPPP